MTWLKHYRNHLPEVPEDGRERLILIADAEQRLAEVQGAGARVTDVSGSLRARNDVNHYARGMQMAFGGVPGE